MNYWKPNNKLIHMWRMGLPTIASKIPSYSSICNEIKYELCVSTLDEWHEKILKICKSERLRSEIGSKIKAFTNKNFSNESIDTKWKEQLKFIYEN